SIALDVCSIWNYFNIFYLRRSLYVANEHYFRCGFVYFNDGSDCGLFPCFIDTRNKAMLDTKPADPKTIAVAKFIHIFIYLILFFTMALTALIYVFVLKVFSGAQLQNTITYIQIAFVVGIIVGYQLIIRTYGYIDTEAAYLFKWWHAVLPPFWFAAPFELIMNQNTSAAIIALSSMAFL